jgi:excisionase family DNA binding protein
MEELRMSPDYGAPDTFTHKPAFLTVDELAKILRVNRNTLYAAIARGEIPGVHHIGGAIRIHRDTVMEWSRRGGHITRKVA